jgi:tetratricopeptide (TPR) repeat protein
VGIFIFGGLTIIAKTGRSCSEAIFLEGVMYRIALLFAAMVCVSSNAGVAQAGNAADCEGSGKENNAAYFELGIQACTRWIAEASGRSLTVAYLNRGHWKHRQGNYNAAIADFDRAISIDPNFVGCYDFKADALMAQGDIDAAIATYDQAIRVDPNYAGAYYSRGLAYEKKGDIARARESYRAVLATPEEAKPYAAIQAWAHQQATSKLRQLDR